MDLYQQELMDHYRNPRNRGVLEHPDFASEQHNPSCGDSVALQGKVENGVVTILMFTGAGCVISQAAASLLTEYCRGKSISELRELQAAVILKLVGIPLGPTRAKCALLVYDALVQALKDYHA